MTAQDNQNPSSSSSATLSVTEGEKWTIRDSGGIGVRDIWCGRNIVCIEVPPNIAKAVVDAHNSSLSVTGAHPKEEQGLEEAGIGKDMENQLVELTEKVILSEHSNAAGAPLDNQNS